MIVIIADDLTGAMDTGIQFTKKGLSTSVLIRCDQLESFDKSSCAALAVNTDSREADGERAAAITEGLVKALRLGPEDLIYKKVDSLMRGNPVEELDAALAASGRSCALAATSFPATGRFVRGGILHMPGGAKKDLRQMFEASRYPVDFLRVNELEEKLPLLRSALEEGPRIFFCDAESDEDLARIGVCGEKLGNVVYCGSAGLANQLIQGRQAQTPERPQSSRILVVTGTRKQETAEQVRVLVETGEFKTVVANVEALSDPSLCEAEAVERAAEADALFAAGKQVILAMNSLFESQTGYGNESVADRQKGVELARQLAGILHRIDKDRYDGLVIIGGDTSRAACAMFGATTISLHSEIESGTAYGLICDGEIKGMPIVTKSGAFGTPQTLKVAVDYMRA